MIKVANAPCSWGVLEFELEGEAPGYEQVLSEIRETGYDGTELGDWGFMPTTPAGLAGALEKENLALLGAFVPVNLADESAHDPGVEAAVRTARLMKEAGSPGAFIVLADDNGTHEERTAHAGRVTETMGLDEAGWARFAGGVDRVAAAVESATGMRTVFHHHAAGFVETEEEIDALMDRTNPDLVGLVFDTGHLLFGGGDPLSFLQKHSDRIRHVHFKDCHPEIVRQSRLNHWDYFESVRQGVFSKLGDGGVDFDRVIQELKNRDYDGWVVVEQDVLPGMGDPRSCARHNREFLKGLGL
ncbi:MAG: TIM barrel protein [Verrucomicrobiota bacterium]